MTLRHGRGPQPDARGPGSKTQAALVTCYPAELGLEAATEAPPCISRLLDRPVDVGHAGPQIM